MADIEVPDRTGTVRFRWASVVGALLAAGLFFASAVLQQMASHQRWVVFRSQLSEPITAEDHLYDYSFPYAPWVPIGNAAELFGWGTLLTATGVLLMPLGVAALTRTARHRAIVLAAEELVAVLVAGSLAVDGAHALLSGSSGSPSSLQNSTTLGLIAVLGVGVLMWLWRASRIAMVACVFVFGSTLKGHFLAAFLIAPLFTGGASHDTTPWTETVVAASVAAAGVTMVIAAVATLRRTAASRPRAVRELVEEVQESG